MEEVEALPPYRVRESARAKRIILRVHPEKGLEVVIPKGFDRAQVPGVVQKKRDWIRDVFRRLESSGRMRQASSPILPQMITLNAIHRSFTVQSTPCSARSLQLVQHPECRLELIGGTGDVEGCFELLRLWLRRQGHVVLVPWLERVSAQTGLRFERVQVRSQKSRWGSCSSRGAISLNAKLLFLPPELVRYILVHELCHTVQMDHSPRFWALVEEFEPAFRSLDREMNAAQAHVPAWALR